MSNKVHENPFFSVDLERRGSHQFYTIEFSDWVIVIPVTNTGNLLCVEQYRHGLRGQSLEFPAGGVGLHEQPERAARRELLEETGYQAQQLEYLRSFNPNPPYFHNRCHVVVASELENTGEQHLEETEHILVKELSVEEVTRLIQEGHIDHGLMMAAFLSFIWSREKGKNV